MLRLEDLHNLSYSGLLRSVGSLSRKRLQALGTEGRIALQGLSLSMPYPNLNRSDPAVTLFLHVDGFLCMNLHHP